MGRRCQARLRRRWGFMPSVCWVRCCYWRSRLAVRLRWEYGQFPLRCLARFVFASLAAGIVEEVIFRGYLVIDKKGRAALIASCVGFSLIFALIHGHFWSHEEGEPFTWTFTIKAFFSTGILLANSLWFYALRFAPWNQNRSLFPCMLAHAASNFGVFAVKWVQGFVIF